MSGAVENGLVPSTAAEFREVNRKVVKLPSCGKNVTIRKLNALDFLEFGNLPAIAQKEGENPEQRKKRMADAVRADPSLQLKSVKMLLVKGVVVPRVVDVVPHDCPDDAITLADLGGDLDWLAVQIQEFSGLAGETAPSPKFQESEPAPAG